MAGGFLGEVGSGQTGGGGDDGDGGGGGNEVEAVVFLTNLLIIFGE